VVSEYDVTAVEGEIAELVSPYEWAGRGNPETPLQLELHLVATIRRTLRNPDGSVWGDLGVQRFHCPVGEIVVLFGAP